MENSTAFTNNELKKFRQGQAEFHALVQDFECGEQISGNRYFEDFVDEIVKVVPDSEDFLLYIFGKFSIAMSDFENGYDVKGREVQGIDNAFSLSDEQIEEFEELTLIRLPEHVTYDKVEKLMDSSKFKETFEEHFDSEDFAEILREFADAILKEAVKSRKRIKVGDFVHFVPNNFHEDDIDGSEMYFVVLKDGEKVPVHADESYIEFEKPLSEQFSDSRVIETLKKNWVSYEEVTKRIKDNFIIYVCEVDDLTKFKIEF